MAVTNNAVYGFGTRVVDRNKWIPADGIGKTADETLQQDSAKFSHATFCNITTVDLVIHIGVFRRNAYTPNETTEFPAVGNMTFINYKVEIPSGTTYSISDFYIDKIKIASNSEDEPILCVWVSASESIATGYLDVIIRR